MRPLTKKPRLHDPSSNEASQSGTWNSLPPSRGCTGRSSRRKKNSHAPHARRSSVWQGLHSWCAGRHRASNHDIVRRYNETPAHSSADRHAPCRSQATLCVGGALPHTEETGPPRPPPESPPGVSTAPPRRTTSSGSTSPCPSCGSVFSSVHNMKAHARRTNSGTPIVAEGLKCGFCDSSTVSPTSASRAFHHQNAKRINEQKTDNAPLQAPMTAVALQPLICCNPHQPLSRDNPREALPHTLWECPRPRQLSIRLFGNTPSRTRAPFKTEKLATSLRTARRPLTNSGCKV
ncbi:hypothetical protein TCDM_10217 [Trypanosoma cruzi Dm28c]|uniref:C2H2-type domain-containing protein n=1 Tax=Trypanosoma cruzi Dm28c TaxID=1416333 RepID=V5B822_TRYCR|nr:hypothetical protein TCDM_10217 [Trypanosoma cruzi Dm28c]